MGTFHKQVVTKQHIYENILSRQTGMDYSPVIRFEKSLAHMDEAKAPTKRNQL